MQVKVYLAYVSGLKAVEVEGRERVHSLAEAGSQVKGWRVMCEASRLEQGTSLNVQEIRDRLGSADTGYGTGRAEEEHEQGGQEGEVSPGRRGEGTQHTEL